ncbi:MAG: metallophosphoesterase family protein [Bryobacteraceae bacterium]
MVVGLLSDTHGFLDESLLQQFKDCDELWHAGDLGPGGDGPLSLLDRLRSFKPLRAVYGNVDGAEIRAELPADLSWNCDGVRVYMTHIGGYPGNYDRRAKAELLRQKPDLFISGHSHILRVMRDANLNLLHMNPGACGHNGWHKLRTALRFTINNEKLGDMIAIELGPRGRLRQPSPVK